MSARDDETRYSKPVRGAKDNHAMAVRFDLTAGCLGITTWPNVGGIQEGVGRVLLTPVQVVHLRQFLDGGDHD